ncbi:MAG: terminase large subunit domain-containing protein [Aridibacter sp.]
MIEATYTRPKLAAYQLEGLFNDARYAIVEASTKAGKTAACLVWLTEQALQGKKGQDYWWVAPVYNQAKIAFRRLKVGLPREIYTANESELSMVLLNGTRIVCKSAEKPDNLYGEDVYGAVFDEASRAREEAWFALRSTLTATEAPVRIIGNVKGRKNWAYHLARKAESGEPDMSYKKITAYDAVEAGILTKEEIEDAKRHLPDAVFRELYLAEPSDDEGNPFGITAIRRCVAPISNQPPVAFGIDLAKSVDWTTVYGLDAGNNVCVFERFQLDWNSTIERIKTVVGKTKALVDSTGVGDPVLESLQKGGFSNFEGYKFTSPSKQQLMEGLAVAIQREDIHFPDGVTVSELESFEFEYTRTGVRYSAPQGMHDDCVCGLALAVESVNLPSGEWSTETFRLR